MKSISFGLLGATLALTACATPVSNANTAISEISPATAEVEAAAIEAHIRFLADDAMEGRNAGERGYDLAAAYVESQYRLMGLEPAGDDGYRQAVPLKTLTPDQSAAEFTLNGKALSPGEDFFVTASAIHEESRVTAPLVFAGYGHVAEQYGLNAYDGLDVEGKIVVLIAGAPEGVPSDVAAHLNSGRTRSAAAEARGAAGLIYIAPEGLTRWHYSRIEAFSVRPSMTTPASDRASGLPVAAYVADHIAERLFEGASKSFAEILTAAQNGELLPSLYLSGTATIAQRTQSEDVYDDNVVAILPGSDAALADEPVIVTAHLDHIGVCRLEEEDSICNGALDNASGTSIMLETARVMAENGAPRRPVVFVALAAEEKGLLGSAHIAQNPTDAMTGMVANINLDMPVIRYEFNDLIGFGAEHSSLGPIAETAAAAVGASLTPDPLPEQALFTRSDHYNFVVEGVPSLFLMTGFSSPNPDDDEGQGFLRFLGGDYHAPGDEVDQVLFDQGAKFARINLAIIEAVANSDQTPSWNEDSFFNTE
jgi:Zn-dependent M28 family amino/carboxypeptidase